MVIRRMTELFTENLIKNGGKMNEIDTKILSFFERAKEIVNIIEDEKRRYYGQDEAVTAWDTRINIVAQMIQAQEIHESY
jgi:hypothetical protein